MASDPALQRHVAEVSAALNAVYNGSGPSHSEADRWLQEFQRSQEAWSVADAMLRMEGAELYVTFFAAQTIHAKIRSNFRELPQESIPSLRDSLVDHVGRWEGAGKRAVITRLCLSLSALALQVNWPDVVKDLTGRLMRAGSAEQQNQAARVLLEFMKVLPEEAVNQRIVVPQATREAFLEQLCASSSFLLSSLEQIAAGPLGTEVMVQETVFQCLQSWVRHVNIPAEDLVRNPLLAAAFDALGKQELFETAVDFLVEVLRQYQTTNFSIVQLMVPKAMALEAVYEKATQDEDENIARGLCRLFTEMAEAYMDVIMAPDDRGQLKLVQLVLLCTAHPDREIATIPLYFWYRFCRSLESLESVELRNARYTMFEQSVVELVGVLLVLMRYPEDIEELSDDKVGDLKRHRYDVADVLRDICRILGSVPCLRQLVFILEQELTKLGALAKPDQAGSWRAVEACLFGIRSIGTGIPVDEAVVVPQVVGMLPRLPGNFHVRYTATLIVGKYADWLKAHPDHLTSMFAFLMTGFSSPAVMPAAATALKNLCHSCRSMMGEQALPMLQEQLNNAKTRSEDQIDVKDELELLEGISYVISSLQPVPAAVAFRRLVEPIAANLQADGVVAGDAKLAQQHLTRLTVIVTHANPSIEVGREHPVVTMIRDIWPILTAISTQFQSSGRVFEKLSRFFKHSMRACKEHFEPLLKPLIDFLVGTFSAVPHSPCLYCGSICVSEFGERGPAFAALLLQMLDDFARAVFRCLQSLEDFTANPDVVEEFYYLVGRFVDYCPEPLVSSPLLSSVVQCGIVGLQLHHREAQKGVLHCFEEVVGLAMPHFPGGKPNPRAQQFGPTIEQMLRDHGQALVKELVKCCGGELPSYSCDGDGGSVAGLLWRIAVLCPSWLQEWLMQALGGLDTRVADNFQKQELMDRLFGPQAEKSRASFDRAVARFTSDCFQNQRSWSNS